MSDIEHCDDDGKGGCTKHPPTMCLHVYSDPGTDLPTMWHWLMDQDCPGHRCSWPARVDYGIPFAAVGAQVQSMADAYNWLLRPKLNMQRRLRRLRAAEKLRANGKVTPGVTFRG